MSGEGQIALAPSCILCTAAIKVLAYRRRRRLDLGPWSRSANAIPPGVRDGDSGWGWGGQVIRREQRPDRAIGSRGESETVLDGTHGMDERRCDGEGEAEGVPRKAKPA
jgi:hypothetical protein